MPPHSSSAVYGPVFTPFSLAIEDFVLYHMFSNNCSVVTIDYLCLPMLLLRISKLKQTQFICQIKNFPSRAFLMSEVCNLKHKCTLHYKKELQRCSSTSCKILSFKHSLYILSFNTEGRSKTMKNGVVWAQIF